MQNRSFQLGVSALILAACCAFSAACGSASADAAAPGVGGAGGNGGADNGGGDAHETKIAFVPDENIQLAPKESVQLVAQTTPAGPFVVRFALFGGDATADAVLDATDVETDAQGIARVTLIAPSKPSTFSVRASTPSARQVAYRGVSVSASGFTALRVVPSYTGHRSVTKWTATATARAGVSCNELMGNPPPDGELSSQAKFNTPLVIDKVPVGVDLAITVRAGHYIGGCATLPALSEGDGNQVLVYASDRPLNLAATDVLLKLGATDAHPAFDKLLQATADAAENALIGDAKNDVAALLDGMRDATPALSREAFSAARAENTWDSALESAFGKNAARRMRDPAQRWFTTGLLALNAADALVGQVAPLGNGAAFMLNSVAGASPSSSGFPGYFLATWSADSSDTLLLGMDLSWEPARLVTTLAIAPAITEVPGATSAELALALSVDCAQVGRVLLAYGIDPGSTAFSSCDESCSVSLCNAAVAAAWSRAQHSSDGTLVSLNITASGTAQVGDEAEATELTGSWVGEFHSGDQSAPVSGALSASNNAR